MLNIMPMTTAIIYAAVHNYTILLFLMTIIITMFRVQTVTLQFLQIILYCNALIFDLYIMLIIIYTYNYMLISL